jgi:hypothetical protein
MLAYQLAVPRSIVRLDVVAFTLDRGHAAVGGPDPSGRVRGTIGRQERDDLRDFLGLPGAA